MRWVYKVYQVIWSDRKVYSQFSWFATVQALALAGAVRYQSDINIIKDLLSLSPRSRAQTLLWLWLLISFFILNFWSRKRRKRHWRKLPKHRRSRSARGGKRCYSLWGCYVTSHLPLSPRNARIVFVNRAAMCVCSRGGSFWVAALAVSPLR